MDRRQIVLKFIRQNGPSFPGQIYKELETDLLLASAFMSELSINGDLKISNVKIGASPLYYISGQEHLLENFIDKLHEKEKRAVLFLKEKLVLRDITLEPILRVSLRQTKDFAKPLYVKVNDKKELFWKWYLLTDSDLLKKKVLALIGRTKKVKTQHQIKIKKKNIIKETKDKRKLKNPNYNKQTEKQTDLYQKITKKEIKIETNGKLKRIEQELSRASIRIIDSELIKKEKEYDLILEVPSALGKLKYYCKFWDKKKINDKDLNYVFVTGQMKKLPVILLSPGELTKKAKTKLQGEMQGITFKRIRV